MHNGINDLTVRHDGADGLGQADDDHSGHHLLAAFQEVLADGIRIKSGNDANHDSQPDEHGCHLRHIPAKLDASVDDYTQGNNQGNDV